MTRRQLQVRILLRSLVVKPGRTLLALAAVIVGAAVVTAVLTLYADVGSKLHREFRSYGANLVISARSGQSLPSDALPRIEELAGPSAIAAPFAYVAATTAGGENVIVGATDFSRAQALDSWWSVTAWPSRSGEALVGVRAAPHLVQAKDFDLTYAGRALHLRAVGRLRTGSEEDTRIYINLSDFEAWTGLQPAVIQVFAPGSPAEVNGVAARIGAALPQAEVQPVRQLVEAEGQVFEKTRSTLLAAVLAIALTAMACLVATLTASVLDRRRDFALMKALGASQKTAVAMFATEAAVLGASGGIIGYVAGLGIAELIGWQAFSASVDPSLELLPLIVVGAIVLAVAAAALPLGQLRCLEPAAVLKGE